MKTVKQVAAELGLGLSTVYDLIHAGELPAIRCGRAIRVEAAGIAAWRERAAIRRPLPAVRSPHFN